MRVIGFNFTKISVERLKSSVENLKISTSMDIPELKQIDSNILKIKEDVLEAKFKYVVNYDPGFAKVDIEGTIILALDSKMAKEALSQWKKKTPGPEDLKIFLYNVVIKKATPKALDLEDGLNLPLHMALPMMRKNKE